MQSQLPHDEEDALKRILRHHGVTITPGLLDHLGQLINWVHQFEQAKTKLRKGSEPPYLLVLLSTMGIHGAKVLDRVPVEEEP